MSNLQELKSAIKEILNENGTLNKIRAEIRESIFKAIESNDTSKPKIPEENLIINELIREYFNYMGYFHSSSVFLSESGHPEDPPVDRNFIAKELNVLEEKNSKNIPLIYSILFGLKKDIYEPSKKNEYDFTNMSIGNNNFNNNNNTNTSNTNTNNFNNLNSLNNIKDQPKGIVFNN